MLVRTRRAKQTFPLSCRDVCAREERGAGGEVNNLALSYTSLKEMVKQGSAARETFLYLVTFAALYTAALSLGGLLFGVVDHFFPDPVQDRDSSVGQNDALRWSIASLVVALPLYLGMTRKHFREYASDPTRLASKPRLWLTYLTLTVLALVLMGTTVDLISNVLGGEVAPRFFLKVAVVVVITATILLFYLWELRWKGSAEET